jgi:hypothetical protein
LLDDAAFNTELAIEPIHVSPFQGEALTNPQPKANADQRYGAEWVFQPAQEPRELVNRETAGLPRTGFSPPSPHHRATGNQHLVAQTDVILMMQLELLDGHAINACTILAAEVSDDELITSSGDDAVPS